MAHKDKPPFAVGDRVVNQEYEGKVFTVRGVRYLAWKSIWTMELSLPDSTDIVLGNEYVTRQWVKEPT